MNEKIPSLPGLPSLPELLATEVERLRQGLAVANMRYAALLKAFEQRNGRLAELTAETHYVDSDGGRYLPCSRAISNEIAYFQRRAESAEAILRGRVDDDATARALTVLDERGWSPPKPVGFGTDMRDALTAAFTIPKAKP